jgi:chaperone required for assembly of F1-ATPase
VLRARAEAAAELDDELAAETWGKAADAAERKLQEAADPSD